MTMTLFAHRTSADYRREKIDRMASSIEILERDKAIAKFSIDRVPYKFLTFAESLLLQSREDIRATFGAWTISQKSLLIKFKVRQTCI